ncbi:MAG: hypothetical protein EZS28_027260 [Streblomastix strix]|uniref:Uncharacterized protein n=1 Tax=Streblomastix strix TaxID=222440 RepID=A0A5J4V545_9EUKA|nr:MAG: hypothetical protein EZS28_027260 [Streblomastix strix]
MWSPPFWTCRRRWERFANDIQQEHQLTQQDTQQQQNLQSQISLKEISLPLHITPKTHVPFNNTISSHLRQEQTKQLGNQQIIQAKKVKGQTRNLNKDVRQGEKGITNYYPRLSWRQVVIFLFEFFATSNRPPHRSDSYTRTDRIGATMVSQQRGEIRRYGDNKS